MKKLCPIAMILAILFCSAAGPALSKDTPPVKTISTEGTAKIWIAPDRARIFMGVETMDESLGGARQRNAETMQRIMDALDMLEIEGLRVQTPAYNIVLVKENEHDAKKAMRLPKVLGYKVTQEFTVLITDDDLDALSNNAGRVLDAALNNGVNMVNQTIMFFKEDIAREKEEVLKLALQDAISRANVMAETAGVTIEDYSQISSGFYFQPRRPAYSQTMQALTPAGGEQTASTVAAAKIPVEARVSLTCILK